MSTLGWTILIYFCFGSAKLYYFTIAYLFVLSINQQIARSSIFIKKFNRFPSTTCDLKKWEKTVSPWNWFQFLHFGPESLGITQQQSGTEKDRALGVIYYWAPPVVGRAPGRGLHSRVPSSDLLQCSFWKIPWTGAPGGGTAAHLEAAQAGHSNSRNLALTCAVV